MMMNSVSSCCGGSDSVLWSDSSSGTLRYLPYVPAPLFSLIAPSEAGALGLEMLLVGARLEDRRDLPHGQVDLLVLGVEMRRDADARAGPKVHEEVAPDQLLRHRQAVGEVDRDRSSAPLRIL